MFTLGDITGKRARLGASNEALIFGTTRITYAQLHLRTNKLANSLGALNLPHGSRVAILAENSHRYIEFLLSVAKAGLVAVPLNFRLTMRELVHMLNDSGAALLFVGDTFWETAQSLHHEMPGLLSLHPMDADVEGFSSYEGLLAAGDEQDPEISVSENELAMLIYTGGTTGLPKGVMLSHRNLLSATISAAIETRVTSVDVTCMFLPMFHVAVWQVLCHLIVGAKVVVLRRPEIKEIMQAIAGERCTTMNAVPTLYNWLIHHPELDSFDLSSIRSMIYSGSPFPEALLRKCIDRFGPIFSQGYGLTEAAPLVSFLRPEDHTLDGPRARFLQSAGRETTFTEVRIGDGNGAAVPNGVAGEVMARGPNIMQGYWNNEALTRERIRGGWLLTGDIGMMDDEGYIFLLDRKADMIVTGGENVYPSEVEGILYLHPSVQECAVTSAPDDHWGERVQAAVVLKPDTPATEKDLIEFCRQRLAGYKCPKRVEFWTELPKTTVGKILRREVKNGFWQGHAKQIG